jgi:hypothetical protein
MVGGVLLTRDGGVNDREEAELATGAGWGADGRMGVAGVGGGRGGCSQLG